MATQYSASATAILGDDDNDDDGESVRSPIVETPTSSSNSRGGRDDESEDDEQEEDEDEEFGGDGASVPLQRLSKRKGRKLGKGFQEGGGGGSSNTGDIHTTTVIHGGDDGDEGELVVRWSQDGGSPTSFRKLRDQHKGTRGGGFGGGVRGRGRHSRNNSRQQYGNRGGRAGQEGGESGFEELLYTAEQERRVVRKMDKYLVGFLAVLYMLSFLDRSNIGNARIAGLTEDLNLTGDQYEWLLTAFYTTYITFEWMTLLWKVIPAHKYIAICVAGWGTIACLQALTTSFTSLFILRLLLGVLEAAFSPGIPFYLSFFYRREELALRIGLIVAAAPLANAYSGSLAWVITSLKTPLAPWRLLLIAEGFPGLVLAVVAWYWFPDGPEDQWWLTARERGIARRRVLVVRGGEEEEDDEGLGDEEGWGKGVGGGGGERDGIGKGVRWREVWSALVDGKNWITAMIFFSCNVSFASLPVFLPTIINDMGYTSITTQLLTFPPYLLSFLLVILTTLLSDRHLTRSPFILLHAATAFLGYLFLSLPPAYLNPPLWLRYLAIYPICVGVFSCVALVIPWTINNQKTATGRGTGMVLMGMVGQLGPLVGVRLFPKREAPGYEVGMGWCAMAMVVVMGLTGGLRWVLVRENGKRGGRGGSGGAEGFRYIL